MFALLVIITGLAVLYGWLWHNKPAREREPASAAASKAPADKK